MIFNCYEKLGMSSGGQEEGDRTHPEVALAPFRLVEIEGIVEQVTSSILKHRSPGPG